MRLSKRVQFLKDARDKRAQNAENNELFSDEVSECESLGSELLGIESLDSKSPSSQSSSDENDWVDELFKPKLNTHNLIVNSNSENSSEEETSEYTLSELEQKIKNEIQDLQLQYTAQYLRLVESGLIRVQATSKRGKHQKIQSLLLDKDVKSKLLKYLSLHKFKLSIHKLCDYVCNEIFPSIGIETGKTINIYVDGHKRSDVVEYHRNFLDCMAQYELLMPDWSDDLMQQINPILPARERLHILVTHDESVFYANDGQKAFWTPIGKLPLCSKSAGGSIMVSEFLCDTIRQLRLDNVYQQQYNSFSFEQQIPTEAHCIIHPGNNHDGYWTISDMAQQLKNKAIPIFEAIHPGCIAVFAFDNSSNHAAFANDALEINYPDGTPKGIYQVLEERGLAYPNLKKICSDCKKGALQKRDCCATQILSLEPDFANQKSLLEEIVEEADYKIIFYPKFTAN
ncbi:1759_t:CDS:2 [Cetraspora pellucida]|uniref:1759_t:CDS:1 n=1 Tax=Cetraspora pellucida TaxID=1433469 RepID=A0A9N9DJU6_9GLOM|nr:1759_t:CDS:2 [Cetraspora pellucida]